MRSSRGERVLRASLSSEEVSTTESTTTTSRRQRTTRSGTTGSSDTGSSGIRVVDPRNHEKELAEMAAELVSRRQDVSESSGDEDSVSSRTRRRTTPRSRPAAKPPSDDDKNSDSSADEGRRTSSRIRAQSVTVRTRAPEIPVVIEEDDDEEEAEEVGGNGDKQEEEEEEEEEEDDPEEVAAAAAEDVANAPDGFLTNETDLGGDEDDRPNDEEDDEERHKREDEALLVRLAAALAPEMYSQTYPGDLLKKGSVPQSFLEAPVSSCFQGRGADLLKPHPLVSSASFAPYRVRMGLFDETLPRRPLLSKNADGLVTVSSEVEQGEMAAHVRSDPVARAMLHVAGDEVAPALSRLQLKKARKAAAKGKLGTAGKKWYDLPEHEMTAEVKNDFRLIAMREHLDARTFYKKDSKRERFPKHFHVGTVIEGAADPSDQRLVRKERHPTLVDSVLADDARRQYLKRKYTDNQPVYRRQKRMRPGVVKGRY